MLLIIYLLAIHLLLTVEGDISYSSNDDFHMDDGNCGTKYSNYGTIYSHAARHELSSSSQVSGYIYCVITIKVGVGNKILLFEDTNNIDIRNTGWFKIYDGPDHFGSGVFPIIDYTNSNSFPGGEVVSTADQLTIVYYHRSSGYGSTGFTLYYTAIKDVCGENDWKCSSSGRCIDSSQKCDDHPGCRDRSDEDRSLCYRPFGSLRLGVGIAITVLAIIIFIIMDIAIMFRIKRKYKTRRVHVMKTMIPPPSPRPPPGSVMPTHTYTTPIPTNAVQPIQPLLQTYTTRIPTNAIQPIEQPPPYPLNDPVGMPMPPPPPAVYIY